MDIPSLYNQSKEKSLQSLFFEMTENIRNNADPQHTARELICAFIVSSAEQEKMDQNSIIYLVGILEQIPLKYRIALMEELVSQVFSQALWKNELFREEFRRLLYGTNLSEMDNSVIIPFVPHKPWAPFILSKIPKIAVLLLACFSIDGVRGRGAVLDQMFAVQQNVAIMSVPISPSFPVHEEKETNISPEFLEDHGMLFIKKTSGMTYEEIVRKIIPSSSYRDRCRTLRVEDFDNFDLSKPHRVIPSGWWIYVPQDKDKQRFSEQEMVDCAQKTCQEEGNLVPWQLMVAIARVESRYQKTAFRQEFNQDIYNDSFTTRNERWQRQYRNWVKRYNNLLGASYGPVQVLPQTAYFLGFRGSPMELNKKDLSFKYGVKLLIFFSPHGLSNNLYEITKIYSGKQTRDSIHQYAVSLYKELEKLGVADQYILPEPEEQLAQIQQDERE
jgi:hypothetical protein